MILALALALSGCGGGGGGGAQALDDIARGIQSAAKSKKTFDALRKADDLEARERAAVNAFCSVTIQLANNGESIDETRFWEDIKQRARSDYGVAGSAVSGPVDKLRALIDLNAQNPGAALRYAQTCAM